MALHLRAHWSAVLALMAAPLVCAAAEPPARPAAPVPPAAAAAPASDVEGKLADAQQRLEAAARDVAELSGQLGRRFAMNLGFDSHDGPPARALLGISIDTGEGQGGARVMNVSPGGAAAEAGIKQGDVVTSIAGEDLARDGNPGRALVEKMRQLDPGLKVQVGVLRDGRKMSFDVTPRPAPAGRANRPFNIPVMPPRGPRGWGPDGPGAMRLHGIEFATLSERLGSYFGVKSGVLVVRAGSQSAFRLQDGDVILSIDGREATSAQHAARILRSYQAGEKLTVRLQRDRKAQTLEVTAPGGDD
jgi:S1-C subfamily serine protease